MSARVPQWSPAFTAGETEWGYVGILGEVEAAMEPGLHGRGNSVCVICPR